MRVNVICYKDYKSAVNQQVIFKSWFAALFFCQIIISLDIFHTSKYNVYIRYTQYTYYIQRERIKMDIIISSSVDEPIYEQIVSQIKKTIISGQLKGGEPLPSMRALAAELRVSLITTKRAYEELEKSGYIETFTGKGSFVKSKKIESLREEYQIQIEKDVTLAVEKAKISGVSLEELVELVRLLYKGGN